MVGKLYVPEMKEYPLAMAASRFPSRFTGKADQLVFGSIATGNSAQPTAGGMAIKDGSIVALGSAEDLEGLRGTDTETVEVGDRVVVPGFVEPHMHLWSTVLVDPYINCSAIENSSFDEVIERLKAGLQGLGEGEWLRGQLYDPSLFPGEPDLDRSILDQISTTHPIAVLNASMHYLYVNSKALELAGLTGETPDPEGGKYYRENGELTGVLGEPGAIIPMIGHMPQMDQAQLAQGLLDILNKAASQGVTTAREAMTGIVLGMAELPMLHQINDTSRLPVRVSTAQASLLGIQKWIDAGVTPNVGDDMVRAVAWKIVSDGSNQGRSGFQRKPYIGTDNCGEANMTPEELTAIVREGHEAGWQIMLHANGDAAIDEALGAFETVLDGTSGLELRHRIEHCSLAHPEQITKMAELGISPSFLMNHLYYWGKALRDNIVGPEAAENLDRLGSAVKNGMRPSLHSDYSVSQIQPLLSARTAVLREMRDGGEVLNASEKVDPPAALRAITVDAAWQVHGDDRGSLEVGKKADFAILSANPWTSDPSTWADIKVHETRIDGTPAWSAS